MSFASSRFRRDERGLTLVELLIVLVVLGVLLAIAVPSYLGMQRRANDAVAKNDLAQARLAAHSYYVDSESFAALTIAELHGYDASIPARVSVASATETDYCLQTTVDDRTWALPGPDADVVHGTCS